MPALLTISNILPYVEYAVGGSPSSGPFAVSFPLPPTVSTALFVSLNGVATTAFTFTPDTDVGIGFPTGVVNLTVPVTNTTVRIWRDMPVDRSADLASGPLNMTALNAELDYLNMKIQDARLQNALCWNVGNGVPSSSVGTDGDMYINLTNGDLYGPKSGGAWTASSLNIKGPTGTPGSMTGPGSAVADNFASFNGTSGNVLKDSGHKDADYAHVTGNETIAGNKTLSGTTIFSNDTSVNKAGAGASQLTVGGSNAQDALAILNANAGQLRRILMQTAGVGRWRIEANTTAEGGANAGSDLNITALDDSGASLGNAVQIKRSSMLVTLVGALALIGGAVGGPAFYLGGNTTTGRYNVGSNNPGEAVSGALAFDWNASRLLMGSGVDLVLNSSLAPSSNQSVGFRRFVPASITTGTPIAADSGKCIYATGSVTQPNAVFAQGDSYGILAGGSARTLTQGASVTQTNGNTGATGNITLAANGFATVIWTSSSACTVFGNV